MRGNPQLFFIWYHLVDGLNTSEKGLSQECNCLIFFGPQIITHIHVYRILRFRVGTAGRSYGRGSSQTSAACWVPAKRGISRLRGNKWSPWSLDRFFFLYGNADFISCVPCFWRLPELTWPLLNELVRTSGHVSCLSPQFCSHVQSSPKLTNLCHPRMSRFDPFIPVWWGCWSPIRITLVVSSCFGYHTPHSPKNFLPQTWWDIHRYPGNSWYTIVKDFSK